MTNLRVGDVIAVPISSGRFGVAHVVANYKKSAYYIEFHDVTFEDPSSLDVEAALAAPLILAGLSFDGRVHSGDWRVIGQHPVRADLRLPPYLLGRADKARVEDFEGQRRRAATVDDLRLLRHRRLSYPMVLEMALQAYFGERPWVADFDGYRPPSPEVLARAYFDDG
jgi:hypothetical protein